MWKTLNRSVIDVYIIYEHCYKLEAQKYISQTFFCSSIDRGWVLLDWEERSSAEKIWLGSWKLPLKYCDTVKDARSYFSSTSSWITVLHKRNITMLKPYIIFINIRHRYSPEPYVNQIFCLLLCICVQHCGMLLTKCIYGSVNGLCVLYLCTRPGKP